MDFLPLETVTKAKGGYGTLCRVQCCVHGYSQEQQDMACVQSIMLCTWIQSTAARHGMCVEYNVVYMDTVNSSKTWHVCRVQCCVHGYSQEQQDMACVQSIMLCTWIQSTAARHGMCVEYNVVYMDTVNSSKTWHVYRVQCCVHGYSQQLQDMACV